jgi:hypothetical protein
MPGHMHERSASATIGSIDSFVFHFPKHADAM